MRKQFLLLGAASILAGVIPASSQTFYVGNSGDNTVDKVDAQGNVSLFASGLGNPMSLALDSNDNLYVGNNLFGSIWKYTPSGQASSFATVGISGARGLAFGLDGYLYVANNTGNYITRFNQSGQYTVVSGATAPIGLAIDPVGDLYYASGGNVMRFSGGTTTQFATGFNNPQGLTFDDSGNLFVSNFGNNSISKVTPSGEVSTYASPATSAGLAGPIGLDWFEGSLYVVSSGSGTLSRIDSAGRGSIVASGFLNPVSAVVVPEPGSLALVLLGAGLFVYRQRRK
jgi:DNA-binding beta-propeller fold protein YncE